MVGKVRGGEVREGELGSKTWREGGSSNNIIINSTQKVSSRVLNSRNMMSVARTSYYIFDVHYIKEQIKARTSEKVRAGS